MLMRRGANHRRQAIIVPPLFHEGERTRALVAALMRDLSGHAVGSTLVELPGLGEDGGPLPASLGPWRLRVADALTACGGTHVIAMRGGVLFDSLVPDARRYRFAPATGPAIVRDLVRSAAVDAQENGVATPPSRIADRAREAPTRLAGYPVPPGLFGDLERAQPDGGAGRTARLAGDARPADARVEGPLLWRQAEPDDPHRLAEQLAADISAWMPD